VQGRWRHRVGCSTDVTDAKAVRALAESALAHFGYVDMWINNVGVGAVGLFDQTPMEAHPRVIEANLLGHMHGAYEIVPHFKSRGRGTLVNMISLGGWVPAPYATAYTASKFGSRGFSEALRAELSSYPHIHVCEVYPTFVDTPGMSHGANHSGGQVRPPPPVIDPAYRGRCAGVVGNSPTPQHLHRRACAPGDPSPRLGSRLGCPQYEMAYRQVASASAAGAAFGWQPLRVLPQQRHRWRLSCDARDQPGRRSGRCDRSCSRCLSARRPAREAPAPTWLRLSSP